jgi:(R)-2-hydroxyacyl-CoA dehydratese activating ATPase
MIVAGCDVGSLTGKAVIMEDGAIKSSSIILGLPIPQKTAELVMNDALKKADMTLKDVRYIVGTGYGRIKIHFAHTNISEISCHAKGANWLLPTVRSVVDIGGQDCKVISINERGDVLEFGMNDKCAAGTGRFLELSAKALGLKLDEMGPESLKSKKPCAITSQCSVFAESEIISLLAENESIADIAAGIHKSIANRVVSLMKRLGFKKDMTISGGVAKNPGIVKFLEEEFGEVKKMPIDPQLIGALGAAILAGERALKKSS